MSDEDNKSAIINKEKILSVSYSAGPKGGELIIPIFGGSQEYMGHVISLIRKYDKQSLHREIINNVLQITILIGAAVVTALISAPEVPKIIPIIFSGLVTIAAAIANYYKFGKQSSELHLTAENMALEYNQLNTRRGIYKKLDYSEAFPLFMDRIETLMHEQTLRLLDLEKGREEHK